MATLYASLPGLCKTWQVFRDGRVRPVSTPKGINPETGPAASSMIVNSSFLVKIIHRINVQIFRDGKNIFEISTGYQTWHVHTCRAGSD